VLLIALAQGSQASAAAGLSASARPHPTVNGVVFDAADQRGQPAGHSQQFPVLADGQLPVQHRGDTPKPGPALDQELLRGHVGVVAAQPVDGDPQAVEGRGVDGRAAQAVRISRVSMPVPAMSLASASRPPLAGHIAAVTVPNVFAMIGL
jgi:hypothetical protein